MANVKITELPVATVVNDADSLVIVQAGVTKQAPNSLVSSTDTLQEVTNAGATTTNGISVGGLLSKAADAGNFAFSAGYLAGEVLQGGDSVAVGNSAGNTNQESYAVAIGPYAGETDQDTESVAIGDEAGNFAQGAESIAIGYGAGNDTQGDGAISLGYDAGYTTQGDYSIALGYEAGNDAQGANGIIISATASTLDDATANHIHIATPGSSLDYTTAGAWDFSSGNVNAVSFTGDGSGLTGVGGATKFYTNLPYMGDDGAQVLLDDDFAIGSDDFYLEIRFLLGSVNGEGKIFALGGTTDATGPNGAFYATKGSFGGVNVYASPTGTVANKFTMLGNAAESPGIYNSIILARSGTNVALYYNGIREYFGNPNEITTLTSGALSLWGLCDGTGGGAGAADGQTSGFLFNKGSSVIDITQTTTATTLGVASSSFSEVAYGSDITLQSALPYLAIGDALESALKFGTEQVGYTYSGSFALKGNPSASVSGEQLATRLYNYSSSINLVAPNDAYIGTRYGAISINYPKTRHDQSAGGSHEFRVNDVVRATINGTDATFVDTVNATAFVGDGSGLTNLPAGGASSLQAVTTVGSTTSDIITVAGLNSARSGAGTSAFSAGLNAGLTSQGNYTVAIGDAAGKTSQGQWAVAIGYRAGEGTQGQDTVGIGNNAGNTLQGNFAVAVGSTAGNTNQGNSAVALGRRAGLTSQGASSVAIGLQAGRTNQAANSIIINATGVDLNDTTTNHIHIATPGSSLDYTTAGGWNFSSGTVNATAFAGDGSGLTNLPAGGSSSLQAVTTVGATTTDAITVGGLISRHSSAGTNSFSGGNLAGVTNQGNFGTALGYAAGQTNQSTYATAIGIGAGQDDQGQSSTAIGHQAGSDLQSTYAVAAGYRAGKNSQGTNAIAIGKSAGETNQAANSIVMNATGAAVENTTANTFVVKPVRAVAGAIPAGFKQVAYNPTTGEFISYG